jgi:hypothetical protein
VKKLLIAVAMLLAVPFNPIASSAQSISNPSVKSSQSTDVHSSNDYVGVNGFKFKGRFYNLTESVGYGAATERTYSWSGHALTLGATKRLQSELSRIPGVTLAAASDLDCVVRISNRAKWATVKPKAMRLIRLALRSADTLYVPATPPNNPLHYPGPPR